MPEREKENLVDALKIARNTLHRTILYNDSGAVKNISELEIAVKIINEALTAAAVIE